MDPSIIKNNDTVRSGVWVHIWDLKDCPNLLKICLTKACLTTLENMKSLNFSLSQLPSIISNPIIPSSAKAGRMVYRFSRTKTAFFWALAFLNAYPYPRESDRSSFALSSMNMSCSAEYLPIFAMNSLRNHSFRSAADQTSMVIFNYGWVILNSQTFFRDASMTAIKWV